MKSYLYAVSSPRTSTNFCRILLSLASRRVVLTRTTLNVISWLVSLAVQSETTLVTRLWMVCLDLAKTRRLVFSFMMNARSRQDITCSY